MTSFTVSISCPLCGTAADWPESPACECGHLRVAAGSEIAHRPHLRLVDPDIEPSPEDEGQPAREKDA